MRPMPRSNPSPHRDSEVAARDRSRFHLPCDCGSVWDFSITNAGLDATDRASPKRLQPLFMPPEALLAASFFSRNECDDEAKPKTACGDDTNRLIKPACVQISTLLYARRHFSPESDDFGRPASRLTQDRLESLTAASSFLREIRLFQLADRQGRRQCASQKRIVGSGPGRWRCCKSLTLPWSPNMWMSAVGPFDEIVKGKGWRPVEPNRAVVAATAAILFARQTL
jgi:hypothetical protein